MNLFRTATLLAAAALAACSDAVSPLSGAPSAAPLLSGAPGPGIDGQYVVVPEKGADTRSIAVVAQAEPRRVNPPVRNGFSATLNLGRLTVPQHGPAVDRVEQSQRGGMQTVPTPATRGLGRIHQRDLPLNLTYDYGATGVGTRAYVIDSGIQTMHTQFAGTVKLVAAMDRVRLNSAKPAAASLSLGYPSGAANAAATSMIGAGIPAAVASGNENHNACDVSPASALDTRTVNASASHFGECIDLDAPGASIASAWIGGSTAMDALSGTSSLQVAGAGALDKQVYGDAASSTIVTWMISASTPNRVTGNPAGTPNRLLYKGTM